MKKITKRKKNNNKIIKFLLIFIHAVKGAKTVCLRHNFNLNLFFVEMLDFIPFFTCCHIGRQGVVAVNCCYGTCCRLLFTFIVYCCFYRLLLLLSVQLIVDGCCCQFLGFDFCTFFSLLFLLICVGCSCYFSSFQVYQYDVAGAEVVSFSLAYQPNLSEQSVYEQHYTNSSVRLTISHY